MCTYEEKNTYTHDRNSIHDTSCRSSSAYMRDSNRFRLVTSNTVTSNTVTSNTVTSNTVTSNTVTSNTVTSNTVTTVTTVTRLQVTQLYYIVKDHSLHSFKEICSSYEIVMPVVCLKFGFETIFWEIKLFLHKE